MNAYLPGWHRRGKLPIHKRDAELFDEEIDAAALPADIDSLKVEYRLKAGQMATHDTMIPHNSPPNHSDRWRRVLVLRYMASDGVMGAKQYANYMTGEAFDRECFLLRGRDVQNKGLPTSPFSD